ncbi:sulfotransferase family protein [uncultured Mucilaginibacter sp.]|uniref:sulfotransferase family protein n=1 Tax=uncultured Mucilaginibacter sp. TaxID=797541 RepID=UPI0025D320B4|nr:sulfotransferase family protein [uncultured Mucilaginibacter sp.]
MALKVIGAGWGRTGTESLKMALEQLGFDRCYHGFDLMNDGRKLQYWKQMHEEGKTDYDALFDGYIAAVDTPAAYYYKELMQQYPEAKVILTVRDAGKWFDSAANTIFKRPPPVKYAILKFMGRLSKKLSYVPLIDEHLQDIFFEKEFNGKIDDKQAMMAWFNQWNEQVKNTVPAHRLLVYNVAEGWGPLCKFLDVPVPAAPFPQTNTKENFQKRVERAIFSPTGARV